MPWLLRWLRRLLDPDSVGVAVVVERSRAAQLGDRDRRRELEMARGEGMSEIRGAGTVIALLTLCAWLTGCLMGFWWGLLTFAK
jgi:hypothetical protein